MLFLYLFFCLHLKVDDLRGSSIFSKVNNVGGVNVCVFVFQTDAQKTSLVEVLQMMEAWVSVPYCRVETTTI